MSVLQKWHNTSKSHGLEEKAMKQCAPGPSEPSGIVSRVQLIEGHQYSVKHAHTPHFIENRIK